VIRLGTSPEELERAAVLLRSGRLVAFPTETVYGLGADASDPEAVAAIFRAKGRPADHPVIVHLPDARAMEAWGRDIPVSAWRLAGAFWPGPLTLVVRKAPTVNRIVTGGQDTVGLRVPGNRVARALLAHCGRALAAPSANRFGRISPTTAEVAAVVDGGPCEVGLESTIVDLSGDRPLLLRPGMISAEAVGRVLGREPEQAGALEGARASGRLPSHYAPSSRVTLVPAVDLALRVSRWRDTGERVVVIAMSAPGAEFDAIHLPNQPDAAAHVLYATLRRADAQAPDRIVVETPPDEPGWAAVRDRLERAAAGD
jgi:L-threonylcarbamoyladenylate synthase